MQTIYQHANYRFGFTPNTKTIHFFWEAPHENMSYEDFQEACSNFLGYGFEYEAQHIMIDVRNFKLSLPPTFPKWQEEEHYPRYYKLGIQKVAYIMPEAALAYAKEIEASEGRFALRNFAQAEEATKWINQ